MVTLGSDVGLTGRQPRAVASALRLLEEVARSGPGTTAQEVAQALGLAPATAYRLLNLLVDEEYLERLPDLRGFALGRRVARLVGDPPSRRVPRAARAVLTGLRGQVRCGVHLVLCSATALRVADADPELPGPDAGLVARHLHASAAGKLLLAEQPEWRDLLPEQRLQRLTPRTLTRADQLDRHLDDVRATGRAGCAGELLPDLACLALPVRGEEGELVAVVTLTAGCGSGAALDAAVGRAQEAAARLAPLLA